MRSPEPGLRTCRGLADQSSCTGPTRPRCEAAGDVMAPAHIRADGRVQPIFGGTTEIQKEIIARNLGL
jgi:alkylation response protein AidB-like acyl-CoA dehydrogenase